MKVETRGKFPGVKLHLEPEEVNIILTWKDSPCTHPLLKKMGKHIEALQKENPKLLDERSPEEIAAILIKEAEKASAQLNHLKRTGGLENLDQEALKKKLLSYVKGK